MSLILEALRKSEAERRRGEAPDVLAPVVVARPAPRPGLPLAARWGAGALALAVVAGLAWWLLRPVAPEAAPPTPSIAGASLPDAALGEEPARSTADPRSDPSAPDNVEDVRSPPLDSSAAATAAASPGPAIASPTPPDAATQRPSPATTAQALPPAGANVAPSAGPIAPPAMPTPPAPPAAHGNGDATTAPPRSSEFISPEATVRLADLSGEERKLLPALKVSMHMWAPDPENRFVIIDGTRLAEGDRVGDATVAAIQADGVTLAWRGRQIRLPIR
jgi:general secretion pathway protein B